MDSNGPKLGVDRGSALAGSPQQDQQEPEVPVLIPHWLSVLIDRIQTDEDGMQNLLDALREELKWWSVERPKRIKAATKIVESTAFRGKEKEAEGLLAVIEELIHDVTPYERMIYDRFVHYNKSDMLPPGFI
jgi:hypothetical protein